MGSDAVNAVQIAGVVASNDFSVWALFLKADIIVKVEIDKQRVVINAEAIAEETRRKARGEADAIFARLDAEARGSLEILSKQAEGFKLIVNAANNNPDAAVKMLIADKLEKLVGIQVEAIKNLKFDKITVWDSGSKDGSSSTANFASNLMKSIPPMKPESALISPVSTILDVIIPVLTCPSVNREVITPTLDTRFTTVPIPVTSRFSAPRSFTVNSSVTVRSPSIKKSPVTVVKPTMVPMPVRKNVPSVSDLPKPTVSTPTEAFSISIISTSTSVTVTIPLMLASSISAKPIVDTPIRASVIDARPMTPLSRVNAVPIPVLKPI